MPLNLDDIKSYLSEVREASSEDPSAIATTAITHHKRLLDTALQLAAAVEHQTLAIQRLLAEDLAAVTTPPLAIAQPPIPYYPYPPQQQYMPAPPPPQQHWPQHQPIPGTTNYPMPQQPQVWAQNYQQAAQQLPAVPAVTYIDEPILPQSYGPARNGQVIQPNQPTLMDNIGAPPPPTHALWQGGRNNVRRDSV